MPSRLIISCATLTMDGLTFLAPATPAVSSDTVTARVAWAVWTVQIGLVTRVVIDPGGSAADDQQDLGDIAELTCNEAREDAFGSGQGQLTIRFGSSAH